MTDICKILKESKKIAVVGLSKDPSKTSRRIADFLIEHGYEVVGVNPTISADVDGIKIYKSIKDIPFEIDIVDVFRRSEDIPEIMKDVLEKNPKVLWLQLGIKNDEAVKPAIVKGITTIQDKCIKIEYYNCGY
ncbi:MAG: CoA-binding protein [Melioribacteraceae bacterium]|nr:MAG: CoA-binding protein [Melioribacteraceae bacterium]